MNNVKTMISVAVAAAIGMMTVSATAPQYPTKPVRIVVTLGPGSAGDMLSRLLADPVGKGLGQQVIVDNRPGAGGNVAAQIVAVDPLPEGVTPENLRAAALAACRSALEAHSVPRVLDFTRKLFTNPSGKVPRRPVGR